MKNFVKILIFLFMSFATFNAEPDELTLRKQLFATIYKISSTVSNLEKGVSDLNESVSLESNMLSEIQQRLNSANTPEKNHENMLSYINGTYKQISQLESSIVEDLKKVNDDQKEISKQIAIVENSVPKCIENSNKLNGISESMQLVQDKLEANVIKMEAMQKTLNEVEKVQDAQQKIQKDQTEIFNTIIAKLDSQSENIAKLDKELSKISLYIGGVKDIDNNLTKSSKRTIPTEILMKLGMTSANKKQ